jgi:hypothetical protein
MRKDTEFIELYCAICQHYSTALVVSAQRLSNNFCPQFTDEECIAIYLWGIIQQKYEVKAIYEFILDYYEGWFPRLPSYQAFNNRICNLSDTFEMLADIMLQGMNINPEINTYLTDSMPIIVANSKRSSSAKVAPELCNKGYCDSKKMYYYGVKLHALGQSQYESIPIPANMAVTPASANDLTVAKQTMLDDVYNIDVFADKAYKDTNWERSLKENSNVSIFTPVKLKKGQKELFFLDGVYSAAVSSVRQPIESFFNWLQEKTHIETASKVRSLKGLRAFLYARIAVGCMLFKNLVNY